MVGSISCASPSASPRRVIIDTDPGTDDAMAILLVLNSPELKVEALTVVPGNTTAAQGLENTLKLVSLAGRPEIPVAAGLVKEVVLMGGAVSGGDIDAVAEFNIYGDPEAARIVFNGGWPLTMVGLEIGRKALFGRDRPGQLKKN